MNPCGLLTILCLMVLVLARPALAPADNLSPVKILSFSALMKLPKQQQVDYIRGVRSIMIDLQKIQKDAHRSASTRRRTNAQIVLLASFIDRAEAGLLKDYIAPQDCPARIFNDPIRKAHNMSGAVFTCRKKSSVMLSECPPGSRRIGALKDDGRIVCVDQRHENLSKYHALRDQIMNPKAGPKVVSTKGAATLRKVASTQPTTKTTVKTTNKSRLTKSDAEEDRVTLHKQGKTNSTASSANADSNSPSPMNETPPTPATSEEPQQKIASTPGNSAPDQIKDHSSDPTFNRFITANPRVKSGMDAQSEGESYTAATPQEREALLKSMQKDTYELDSIDEATADKFSQDVVALEKDAEGDFHYSRRKISNFQTNLGSKKLEATAPTDDLCKSPPPEKPVECTDAAKKDAEKALVSQKKLHCFSPGGMISHFDREERDENGRLSCAPAREFCLNTITCRKYDDDFVNGAQVLLHCNSNQIICNPYLFNVDNDQKPFCVSKSLDANAVMQKCADLSDADKNRPTFVLNTSAPNGTIEGWNEFANEFNQLCFNSDSKQSTYYCQECAFLKNRIWKLNAATLESTHINTDGSKAAKADLCSMMTKLEMNHGTNEIQRASNRQTK